MALKNLMYTIIDEDAVSEFITSLDQSKLINIQRKEQESVKGEKSEKKPKEHDFKISANSLLTLKELDTFMESVWNEEISGTLKLRNVKFYTDSSGSIETIRWLTQYNERRNIFELTHCTNRRELSREPVYQQLLKEYESINRPVLKGNIYTLKISLLKKPNIFDLEKLYSNLRKISYFKKN